jgi:hypothetical protein
LFQDIYRLKEFAGLQDKSRINNGRVKHIKPVGQAKPILPKPLKLKPLVSQPAQGTGRLVRVNIQICRQLRQTVAPSVG